LMSPNNDKAKQTTTDVEYETLKQEK
jgi:hypothetical protein